ncbi:hypothetical protein [Paracoccus beibuensis]|uniref:hypothetical protein n=1 Tax=Paracoccus beibuensis TaxID=547602 RepID=UPI0022404518|nr:hypothetical protein [Paracoccus beibuensis]
MAELGKFKDRNAERLKKAERLKRAQSVKLPDPMVGYAKSDTAPVETPKTDDVPPQPAAEQVHAGAASAPEPAKHDTKVVTPPARATEPVQELATEPARKPEPVREPEPEPEDKPAPVDEPAPDDKPIKNSKPAAVEEATPEAQAVVAKLTFQFSEAMLPRVEALAKKLGVKPQAILMKVAKGLKVTPDDFTVAEAKRRAGPLFRHAIGIPEDSAKAWLKAQDPLNLAARPGSVLRKVALNAFDRAADDLLKQLEVETA